MKKNTFVIILVLALSMYSHAEKIIYDVDLTTGNAGGGVATGGAWDSGWRVTANGDRLVFDAGVPIARGYIEITYTMNANPFANATKTNWFGGYESSTLTHGVDGDIIYIRSGDSKYQFSRLKASGKAFDATELEHDLGATTDWKTDDVTSQTVKLMWEGNSITYEGPGGPYVNSSNFSVLPVDEIQYGFVGGDITYGKSLIGLRVLSFRMVDLDGSGVNDVPVITTALSQNVVVNQAINLQLVATGNGRPFTWTSTTLPSGLNLSSDGLLTGTQSALGTSTFSVTVTDAEGDTDTKLFTLEVLDAASCTPNSYTEVGGEVVIEAESHYTASLNGDVSGASWNLGTSYAGFSGTGYIQTIDNNITSNGAWASASDLSYKIQFTTTGNYNVWLNRYASDGDSNSLLLGVDGVQFNGNFDNGGTGSWGWVKSTIGFTVNAAGVKTFNLRRREDGYAVDKILITTSATTPTGNGPTESYWCVNTSISSLSSPAIIVFPNPASNFIQISNSSFCDQLIIYDVLSREQVNAKVNGDGQIDISSLSPNIYMVRLLKDGKVLHTQKLIKR